MDARQILDVAVEAGEDDIRAAYLKKVKEHPPDHSPAEFERIRDAYETLRDPRKRMREMLSTGVWDSFASVLAGAEPERRFVGPQPWLEVLKSK